jgi:hypothetical protein
MNREPIFTKALAAAEHAGSAALQHLHPHPGHHPLPANFTQEPPMAHSLTDTIRQEAHNALEQILRRYLTPTNMAHALAEALDTEALYPGQLTTPPPPPPVAVAVDDGERAQPGDPDAPETP